MLSGYFYIYLFITWIRHYSLNKQFINKKCAKTYLCFLRLFTFIFHFKPAIFSLLQW